MMLTKPTTNELAETQNAHRLRGDRVRTRYHRAVNASSLEP